MRVLILISLSFVSSRQEFVSFQDVSTGPLPVRQPPIWVGGASDAAIRRSVRFGDAWHPLNQRISWLREYGIPELKKVAVSVNRPVPGFAPRLPLRLTDYSLDDNRRLAGQGSRDQVRRDLYELAELGATHVLFDTYLGTPKEMRPADDDHRLLDAIAEDVLLLQRG